MLFKNVLSVLRSYRHSIPVEKDALRIYLLFHHFHAKEAIDTVGQKLLIRLKAWLK